MEKLFGLIVLFLIAELDIANSQSIATIYIDKNANKTEIFAAHEIKKYVYQRTGDLLPIIQWNGNDKIKGDAFIVGCLAEKIKLTSNYNLPAMEADAFLLKTIKDQNGKKLIVYGGGSNGTLYAAYRIAETMGIGFYLEGDVIPDKRIPFTFPMLDIKQKPLFSKRGILPFHDFPEGPDLWNLDDYKAIIGQLPKMGLNFVGLHTYTQDPAVHYGGAGYEPMVWIGTKSNIKDNGDVKMSYPSSHFTTARGQIWSSYETTYTSDYYYGASQLFEVDDFGAEYMIEAGSKRQNFQTQNQLFNSFGVLLSNAFKFAKRVGVQTCLGTETPLTLPAQVRDHITLQGKNPKDSAVIKEVYEGIFERIKLTHPLDYYWIWTPEIFMSKFSDVEVAATLKDLRIATEAAKAVGAPFSLATCGWTLGPPKDRTLFDKILPKEVAISCINVNLGRTPIQYEFAAIEGRPKWAIPWLEDDPYMTIPQLWAGRMRKDAADALAYNCNGLIGIHWRTRIISPNISALAKAAWDQTGWNLEYPDHIKATDHSKDSIRDLPVNDFYKEWAGINFGEEAADKIGSIFVQLDGTTTGKKIKEKLPKPATWEWGPGGIRSDDRSWDLVKEEYQFVGDMETLQSEIKGPGNLERFEYWLNQFKYIRAMAQFNCVWGQYRKELEKVLQSNDMVEQRRLAINNVLPYRIQMVGLMENIQNYLTLSISTNGELGVLCNWQQRMIPKVFRGPGLVLEKFLGSALPENAQLPKEYKGAPHIIVPTNRGSLEKDEALVLKIRTITPDNAKPDTEKFYWKIPGENSFHSKDLEHVARGVYQLTLNSQDISKEGFEYYIEIKFRNGARERFPATSPYINQYVTIM